MLEITNAAHLSINQLATDLTHCFEDYVIPAVFSPPFVSSLVRTLTMDLLNTIVGVKDGKTVGIVLICRREDRARLGVMGIAKSHRRQGVGTILLTKAINEARERGEKSMVLEAIETNAPAIAFYESLGFSITSRLPGFTGSMADLGEPADIREINFAELGCMLKNRPPEQVVWEMEPGTMLQMTHPSKAFEFEGLGVGVSPIGDDAMVLRTLSLSDHDDERKLVSVMSSLNRRYPGRTIKAPPYFPEEPYKNLFLGLGFEEMSISQVLMKRDL